MDSENPKENKDPKELILEQFDKEIVEKYLPVFLEHPQGFKYMLINNKLSVISFKNL